MLPWHGAMDDDAVYTDTDNKDSIQMFRFAKSSGLGELRKLQRYVIFMKLFFRANDLSTV